MAFRLRFLPEKEAYSTFKREKIKYLHHHRRHHRPPPPHHPIRKSYEKDLHEN